MRKPIAEILVLGWVIAFGCSSGPVREQTNTSLPLTNAPAIDLNAAIARAGIENKLVLLDFTGSDWCGPCMALQKELFAQPEFHSYAESNLIFFAVDFPSKYRFSSEAAATNDFLAARFNVRAFPTLIMLDGSGKQIWQQVGFVPGTAPKEWFATFDTLKAKSKAR
jgi:thioredoxin-related protein